MRQNEHIVDQLLNLAEGQEFECKRADVQPAKLLETICAFANAQGGIIALGLEDPDRKIPKSQRIIGVDQNESLLSELQTSIRRDFNPILENGISVAKIPVVNNQNIQDNIALISVTKSNDIHSLYKGDTFLRIGNSNRKIGVSEITRLRYEKGALKYEDELAYQIQMSDFDANLLYQYKKDVGSSEMDDLAFLKDNGLAKESPDNKIIPTKASVLLFGKNPAVMLSSKCSIKILHYYGKKHNHSGTSNFVQRPFTIEGSLLYQIEQTVAYYGKIVSESAPKLAGAKFYPTILIPEYAFQEAVTNAVIHRNYNMQDDIQIRIFDDKIEISSPGAYPGHITHLNIRKERFARNYIIQRTLNRFRASPNLDIGEGVERIFQVMKEHNLYEPVYSSYIEKPNRVELYLYNLQKIDYWDTVKKYLVDNYKINNKQVREITNIADSSKVSRMLKQWVNQELLEKVDHEYKGNIYYRLSGSSNLFKDTKIN